MIKLIGSINEIEIHKFYEEKKGVYLQLTQNFSDTPGYIQLNIKEAKDLIKVLDKWIKE